MRWSPTPVASALSRRERRGQCAGSHAGPRLSHTLRGSIPTLLTCSPRLLTFVSSRQRVSLPGRWLACALGRIFTSWITSTDFIEEAILESQQLRVYLVTTRRCSACF